MALNFKRWQLGVYLRHKIHQVREDTKKAARSYMYAAWLFFGGALIVIYRGHGLMGSALIALGLLCIVIWDVQKGRHIEWNRKRRSPY